MFNKVSEFYIKRFVEKKLLQYAIENSKKYPERFQPVPDGYREKSVKTLTRNIKHAETIYENETHSALAQFVTGTNTHELTNTNKDSLKELFNAYKELHE